jgi:conjugative transposon TraM protein
MKRMETVQYSQAYLRKRKMMLVLPVLVLPFLTLAFWALGGGEVSAAEAKEAGITKGLNLQLPNAKLKEDKGLNKLSYYEIAAADSAKLKERMRNDPYFKVKNITTANELAEVEEDTTSSVFTKQYTAVQKPGLNSSPYNKKGNLDPNEENVLKKLNQLNAALDNTASGSTLKNDNQGNYTVSKQPSTNKEEVDRLENMMQSMQQKDNTEDPEMKQINGMLEKIMDIQHPERIKDKLQQNSIEHKQQVFPVTSNENNTPITLLTGTENRIHDTMGNAAISIKQNTFYSVEDSYSPEKGVQNALSAVIHETQTIVSGSTIKLRLLNDVYINGALIPKDNFVFGTASLNGERLIIEIKSIRYNNSLFPVALSVSDMDGMDGIYIPGAIARTSAKESSDKAIQSVALNSLDPSVGAQAASAGIEAAKTLLSKKVKLVKVTLKAGYQVLLKDNNTK